MTDLLFATQNQHKRTEIANMLGNQFQLSNLNDIGFSEDIPETQDTLEGNALQKAHYVHDRFHRNCFADDTGLEVVTLDGAPGVYSARYAGPDCRAADNIKKLLNALEGKTNRRASFRTVIALILDGKEYLFEGSVSGVILKEETGTDGFGYDPIFRPDGYEQSFAEMSMEDKNTISHRGRATRKLVEFLQNR